MLHIPRSFTATRTTTAESWWTMFTPEANYTEWSLVILEFHAVVAFDPEEPGYAVSINHYVPDFSTLSVNDVFIDATVMETLASAQQWAENHITNLINRESQ